MMIRNNVTEVPNKQFFDHEALRPAFASSISSVNRTHQNDLVNELSARNMFALLNDSFILNENNNVTNLKNTTDSAEDSYSLELWQRVFWSTVFSLMVIIAFLGNSGVIMIVLLNKQMRTVTNMFIVNLSIADLLVSSGNVIFNFVYMLNGHWLFGKTYCKISNFIAILSVACSCFTLMAISVDRFIAIVYPLKPRMSLMTALNITVGIWTASSLLSLPNFVFSTIEQDSMPDGEIRIMCLIRWPDGLAPVSIFDYYYNLAVLILTYFLPITLMTLSYFKVATVLWGSKTIGECSSKQAQSIKSKRKIVKMMVLVLISFAVLWLPYHIYFILQHHLPEITKVKHAQHIFLTLYWLAMSTSMLNPPIYCWLNSRFRRGFKKALFCEYCKANANDERSDQRKIYLRACKMGYLKRWPSSSEPQSTSESTAHKFKCSSSASSHSQWFTGSSNGGGMRELPSFGQVLTVYPNNHFSSRLSTSASTSGNQSSSLLNIQQAETTSLTNSDQSNDHKSPINVRIVSSDQCSNDELNNNTILQTSELERNQIDNKFNATSQEINETIRNTSNATSVANTTTTSKLDSNLGEGVEVQESKSQQIKQKKFTVAAKQLNKPHSTSHSYSTVCLKNKFDAIEMAIEPSSIASSCSSVYSRKSQVDQV